MANAVRLTSEHAEILARFESAYPAGMRQGLERIRSKLELLEQSRFSFSWLLLNEGQPLGYIVAYPSKSLLDVPDPDVVVYVDDLQVGLGQAVELYRLLKLMVEDKELADLGSLHIEALCRRSAYKVLAEHPQVIGRLGYELLGKYEYWEDSVGEEMAWMRWAPAQSAGPDLAAHSDSLILSTDLLEELEFSR